jgi:RNA polymerase sigma-70 factor (ECF subfamily)
MSDSDVVAGLIQAARHGDVAASDSLCRRMRAKLRRWATGQIPGALGAKVGESDLVQEALIAMSQSIIKFAGTTEAELSVWARGILENKSLEIQRRFLGVGKRDLTREQPIAGLNSSELGAVLMDDSTLPLDKLVCAEDVARIRGVIAKLPPHYQSVLELRCQEGLTFPEISTRLNRTEASAKSLFVRAMQILQTELK